MYYCTALHARLGPWHPPAEPHCKTGRGAGLSAARWHGCKPSHGMAWHSRRMELVGMTCAQVSGEQAVKKAERAAAEAERIKNDPVEVRFGLVLPTVIGRPSARAAMDWPPLSPWTSRAPRVYSYYSTSMGTQRRWTTDSSASASPVLVPHEFGARCRPCRVLHAACCALHVACCSVAPTSLTRGVSCGSPRCRARTTYSRRGTAYGYHTAASGGPAAPARADVGRLPQAEALANEMQEIDRKA